jgi:hypothetical protein
VGQWTVQNATKFLNCADDEERLALLRAMFNVSDSDYNYNVKLAHHIDFELANGLYCIGAGLGTKETNFVCKCMTSLWQEACKLVESQELPDFVAIRSQLSQSLKKLFGEIRDKDPLLSREQIASFLNYATTVFLRPIRLIMFPFYNQLQVDRVQEERKIYAPANPVSLSECVEPGPYYGEDKMWPLLPTLSGEEIPLEDFKEILGKYTSEMIGTINSRFDTIDSEIERVKPLLNG